MPVSFPFSLSSAKSPQSCPTLCDPMDGSPPSLGFSRQEHWSGLPFPPPVHESEKWKWSRSVVSDSSRPHGLQPTRLLCPWDSPGKSSGEGCHCLLRLSPHLPFNFHMILSNVFVYNVNYKRYIFIVGKLESTLNKTKKKCSFFFNLCNFKVVQERTSWNWLLKCVWKFLFLQLYQRWVAFF